MCLGKLVYQDLQPSNKVCIRYDGVKSKDQSRKTYWLMPDVSTFPLYCPVCFTCQSVLFVHQGSDCGHVGSAACERCGFKLNVADNASQVFSIITNVGEIFFREFYLLDEQYIEALEKRYFKSFQHNHLLEALKLKADHSPSKSWTVEAMTRFLAQICSVRLTGCLAFRRDSRFDLLPKDINLWFELLYRAGIPLPNSIQVKF